MKIFAAVLICAITARPAFASDIVDQRKIKRAQVEILQIKGETAAQLKLVLGTKVQERDRSLSEMWKSPDDFLPFIGDDLTFSTLCIEDNGTCQVAVRIDAGFMSYDESQTGYRLQSLGHTDHVKLLFNVIYGSMKQRYDNHEPGFSYTKAQGAADSDDVGVQTVRFTGKAFQFSCTMHDRQDESFAECEGQLITD